MKLLAPNAVECGRDQVRCTYLEGVSHGHGHTLKRLVVLLVLITVYRQAFEQFRPMSEKLRHVVCELCEISSAHPALRDISMAPRFPHVFEIYILIFPHQRGYKERPYLHLMTYTLAHWIFSRLNSSTSIGQSASRIPY